MSTEETCLLSYREAAELIGCSEATLRRLVSKGKLPHLKIGRSVRFTKQMLIDDHYVPATAGGRSQPAAKLSN
jgi:excisionase family DNA binding protein